jgi:molecular chaperone DnaK (HSP70)
VSRPRYLIGIDLGTTNSAVAFVDTGSARQRVQRFDLPQLVAPGEVQARSQLPSFVYLPGEHDLGPAETALPWGDQERVVVGELARSQGARVPARVIASAKSWLCHGGVDRSAPILPWGSEITDKLSPIDASARILAQIAAAWNHRHAGAPAADFAAQEITVTVPASFDEAARELTLLAAQRAGYGPIVLLEEPQAAFYAWIDAHPPGQRKQLLQPGDRVLVCDIGGGTTDFTLITVGADGDSFERVAVGDHLLLGGDNVDLTLAKRVEARLTAASGRKLDPVQWHGLVHACRLAKEQLLADPALEAAPVTVVGRSSRLIGGTLKERIDRGELDEVVAAGFFPPVARDAVPVRSRGGLQEFGLPYAADPAVTRHLASFLARHEHPRIDAVLFNGGTMTPASLRRRLLEQVAAWQPDAPPPRELANDEPALAVAQGAAYYGLVRRGLGARIRGGTPRAFYVGVGGSAEPTQEMAVCLAPKGLEDGARIELPRDFALVTNRPVSFKLYSSSSREDPPGALVPVGDGTPDMSADQSDLLELPPIVTVLRAPGRAQVTVHLEVRITELGALEIWCTDQSRDQGRTDDRPADTWRLSFDMRAGGAGSSAAEGAAAAPAAPAALDERTRTAQELVRQVFRSSAAQGPVQLVKELEKQLEQRRDEWPTATARALFDAALDVEEERKRSAEHEARWLNLAGFALRPGSGAPLDQWRARQMWRIFNDGLAYPKNEANRLAWWILWRRIAGGLTKGQQEQLFDRLAQLFLPSARQKKKWYELKPTPQEAAEMWRTLANLERLSTASKIRLGDELTARLEQRKAREEPLYFWALGRIAARVPLYGPLDAVIPPQRVSQWLETVLALDWPAPERAAFPLAQIGRRTGDRSRDIGDDLRSRLAARLRETPGGERMARLVEEIVALEDREERVALGDTLPAGLRLLHDDELPPPG